jgi:hypothetical protein
LFLAFSALRADGAEDLMTAPSVEQYRTLREADQIAETITVLDARLA